MTINTILFHMADSIECLKTKLKIEKNNGQEDEADFIDVETIPREDVETRFLPKLDNRGKKDMNILQRENPEEIFCKEDANKKEDVKIMQRGERIKEFKIADPSIKNAACKSQDNKDETNNQKGYTQQCCDSKNKCEIGQDSNEECGTLRKCRSYCSLDARPDGDNRFNSIVNERTIWTNQYQCGLNRTVLCTAYSNFDKCIPISSSDYYKSRNTLGTDDYISNSSYCLPTDFSKTLVIRNKRTSPTSFDTNRKPLLKKQRLSPDITKNPPASISPSESFVIQSPDRCCGNIWDRCNDAENRALSAFHVVKPKVGSVPIYPKVHCNKKIVDSEQEKDQKHDEVDNIIRPRKYSADEDIYPSIFCKQENETNSKTENKENSEASLKIEHKMYTTLSCSSDSEDTKKMKNKEASKQYREKRKSAIQHVFQKEKELSKENKDLQEQLKDMEQQSNALQKMFASKINSKEKIKEEICKLLRRSKQKDFSDITHEVSVLQKILQHVANDSTANSGYVEKAIGEIWGEIFKANLPKN